MCLPLFSCFTSKANQVEIYQEREEGRTQTKISQVMVNKAMSSPSTDVRPHSYKQMGPFQDSNASSSPSFPGARAAFTPPEQIKKLPLGKKVPPLVLKDTVPGKAAVVEQSKPLAERRVKILVAEDVKINQKLMIKVLCHVLKIKQDDISMASDGKEALAFASERKYDLIITDHHMPSPDGAELTRLLRGRVTSDLNAETPIIAWTTHEAASDRYVLEKAGVNGFMTKAISKDEITQIAKKYLPGFKIA
jgi:CheY-like chemotaxis protein